MNKQTKTRQAVLVDMNDNLMSYAKTRLPHQTALAATVAAAATPDLAGLDDLFKDQGHGRATNFLAIGEGYLVDAENLAGSELQAATQELAKAAIANLAQNPKRYDNWQR